MDKALDSGAYHLDGEYFYVDESIDGAYFNGVSSLVSIYSPGLNSVFNGQEVTFIARAKVNDLSEWSDGHFHNILMVYGAGCDMTIDINNAGELEGTYFPSTGFPFARTVITSELNWFSAGFSMSVVAGEYRFYKDGVQQGATINPMPGTTWTGALSANGSGMSIGQPWHGWIGDCIISFGVVATPTQMLTIHNALNNGTLTTIILDAIFGVGAYAWWKLSKRQVISIWERTKAALTDLGVPISANLHLEASGTELPDLFLVYFLVSSPPEQSADDVETLRSYRMQVSAYSRTGLIGLPDIDGAMVAAGFSRGPQHELPFNQLTGHFGLALEYVYLEEE